MPPLAVSFPSPSEEGLRHSETLARLYSFLKGFHSRMKGRDNRLVRSNSILRRCTLSIEGNHCEVTLGRKARLWDCSISVVGQDCRLVIGDHCALRGVRLVIEDSGTLLSIGAHTTMTKATVVAQEGGCIRIGEDCMVSQEAVIRNSDGHSLFDGASGQRLNPAMDIDIERHCWVGIGALILGGTRLEEGCVVGAGALVKRNRIPGASVVVGRPARITRRNVLWSRERL